MTGTKATTVLRGIIAVLVLLGIWWVSTLTLFNPMLIPGPVKVALHMKGMIADGELAVHVAASLQRILIGFVLGGLSGVAIGSLIGMSRVAEDLLEPPLQVVRNITPVALVPFAIHALGLGEASKYFVIWYATIVPVIFGTAMGVASTPSIRIRAARSLGARQSDIFVRIIMPSAAPFIMTGLRIALGFSFMGVVAAEMIAARSGVGFLIMQSRDILLPEQMFSGLITLGVIGLITDLVFQFLIRRTMRKYMLTAAVGDAP